MFARGTPRSGRLRRALACAGLPAVVALCACGTLGGESQIVAYEYRPSFGFVRIERIEPGAAPNAHPASLPVEALRSGLARLEVTMGSVQVVFTAEELAEIVPHVAAALAKAGPGEDVTFAVAGRHGTFGTHSPKMVTTGRIFVREGRLNLIFGMVHQPYMDGELGPGTSSLAPGSRARARDELWKLAPQGARLAEGRSDWAMLDLGAPKADAAASVAGDGYREIQGRLRTLERLKADGLITEEEYRDRRRAILERL